MEKGDVEVSYNCTSSFPHERASVIMSYKGQYGLPDSYNPADHPPVKMRSNTNSAHHSDLSEAQRKRRSKNRLSNRRSTGYVSDILVEEALKMGADGIEQRSTQK